MIHVRQEGSNFKIKNPSQNVLNLQITLKIEKRDYETADEYTFFPIFC